MMIMIYMKDLMNKAWFFWMCVALTIGLSYVTWTLVNTNPWLTNDFTNRPNNMSGSIRRGSFGSGSRMRQMSGSMRRWLSGEYIPISTEQ